MIYEHRHFKRLISANIGDYIQSLAAFNFYQIIVSHILLIEIKLDIIKDQKLN